MPSPLDRPFLGKKRLMFKVAIRFLLYDKAKSAGALAGVVISIFLIGQQSGIFLYLTNAMASMVKANNTYIWVVDEKTTNVNALSPLDIRLGREVESLKGVRKVYPIVIATGSAKFANGKSSGITLIGTQPPNFIGGPWNIASGQKEDMIREGAIFTDYFDSRALGGSKLGEYFEINGKKVFIAGQTKGVRGFGAPVYSFTTIDRARSLANFNKNRVSAYLVDWDKSIPREEVIARINAEIVGVKAWNSEEFSGASVITVLKSSGIAISFGTLIIFALISGTVIIGLTLYSSAIDRIKDYGTLKAIGATDGYITKLILIQAALFAIIGFIVGRFFIEMFRRGIANAGTIFSYPLWLQATFFLITLFIAMFGSYFAIRRIANVEPAQVFKG